MVIIETESTTSTADERAAKRFAWEEPSELRLQPDLYGILMVEPGTKVALSDIDPDYCGIYRSYAKTLPIVQSYVQRIDQLQYLMHAEKKHSLLIVLQGVDAGGKDGVVRHVLNSMNPAGCRVTAFKQPTPTELAHDFLWRVHSHAPPKGEVMIFNRSHYEDVLVARVRGLVPASAWPKRYGLINDFERLLAVGNDTTVLKFFLHISKEEQLTRFKLRLDDPSRRWKISEADYEEREYWDHYVVAFEEMLYRTSTWHAPWFVVPSNNRWFRDLAISQIVSRTLENLDMKLPEPAVDIERIRRRYHAAAQEFRASQRDIGKRGNGSERELRK
jgi:PPK2 family polyphosphate:nucleotide phosphotransferase